MMEAVVIISTGLMAKFCKILDHALGCRSAYGTASERRGACKVCPLFIFSEAMVLMAEKHLLMGEAVRSVIRRDLKPLERREMLSDWAKGIVDGKREYPEKCDLATETPQNFPDDDTGILLSAIDYIRGSR